MLDVRLKEKSGPLLETLHMLYVQTQKFKKKITKLQFLEKYRQERNFCFFNFMWTFYFNYRCHQKALAASPCVTWAAPTG